LLGEIPNNGRWHSAQGKLTRPAATSRKGMPQVVAAALIRVSDVRAGT
jgi:hypothetical protein